MTPRRVSADEARWLLDGTTEGPWMLRSDQYDPEDDRWSNEIIANFRCLAEINDRNGVSADGHLMAASWDLAHTVIALHEEIARLRETIDGRTTGPTDDEIEAWSAKGGAWLGTAVVGGTETYRSPADIRRKRDLWLIERWRALDANDCPCAWPVVDAQNGGA